MNVFKTGKYLIIKEYFLKLITKIYIGKSNIYGFK